MATPKLRRWMDLLAALLRHRYPLTFEELRQQVPAYQRGQATSGMASAEGRVSPANCEIRSWGSVK